MSSFPRRLILLALVSFVLVPATAHAAGVAPVFDLTSPSGAPFPSDRYTVADTTQLTGVRVDLPKPNCTVQPSDCADIDVLNTLDGFNIQPRLSIPFTGAIDVASVSSANVFLVRLSDGAVTGINQIVWESPVNTLHAESDQLLDQHSRYLLVVTNGVKDGAGDPIDASSFLQDLNYGHAKDAADKAYRKELIAALNHSLPAGVGREDVAAASLFTTQSATTLLEQVRKQIKASNPAAADFRLGTLGERTVFPLSSITGITFSRQITDAAVLRQLHGCDPGALALSGLGRDSRLRLVSRRPTTKMPRSSFPRSAQRREYLPSRARTGSTSTSSSPPAPPPRAAGRWRSSGTASATTRTRARPSSPRRWHVAASPRSRSTSSVTAAARSGR